MPYVHIQTSDGEFDVDAMSDESADHLMQQGGDPVYIEDDVFEAWVAHKKQHTVFNALWRTLQNAKCQHLVEVKWRGMHFNCPGCGRIVKNQEPPK